MDVKRDISHLCTDGRDCYLAVIQVGPLNERISGVTHWSRSDSLTPPPPLRSQSQDAASQDTVCRLYQVGRHQLAEESDHDQVTRASCLLYFKILVLGSWFLVTRTVYLVLVT